VVKPPMPEPTTITSYDLSIRLILSKNKNLFVIKDFGYNVNDEKEID
jgi:hypothetical protein